MSACMLCSFIALAIVIGFAYYISKKLSEIEKNFNRLFSDSDGRIGTTREMIETLSASINKCEELLLIVTKEYTKHLEKLQESRDKVVEQNHQLTQTNAMLTTAATQPRTVINNQSHD